MTLRSSTPKTNSKSKIFSRRDCWTVAVIQSDGRTGAGAACWVAVFKRRLSLHYIWVKRKDNTKDTKYEWKYIVLNEDFYRFAIKIFTVFPSNPYCFPLNFLPFPLQFFTGSAFLNRFSYGPGHRGHTVKYAYVRRERGLRRRAHSPQPTFNICLFLLTFLIVSDPSLCLSPLPDTVITR